LQRDKIDVFESCAIDSLAKHDRLTPCLFTASLTQLVHPSLFIAGCLSEMPR
jgi:hypothetical protein